MEVLDINIIGNITERVIKRFIYSKYIFQQTQLLWRRVILLTLLKLLMCELLGGPEAQPHITAVSEAGLKFP